MYSRYRSFAAFSVLLFLIQGGVAAFTFSPISQEFSTEGKNSSHIFTIKNDSLSERIAVKVSVFKRLMDEEGNESLEPCPGDFLIYPAQSLLNPGDSRSVRIKWQGGPVGRREKAYRIIAEQLPVDFREDELRDDGGGIRFTFRYEGSLYVLTPGAEPDVKLLSMDPVPGEEIIREVVRTITREIPAEEPGEAPKLITEEIIEQVVEEGPRRLKLLFENSGNRHAILGDLTIQLESRYDLFESIILGPADLAGISGENILAGNQRSFLLPEPSRASGEDLKWSFTYKPVY